LGNAVIATILSIAFGLASGIVVGSFFIWIAAKIVKIEDGTFCRSMGVCAVTMIASILINLVFSLIPVAGSIIGTIVSLIASIWIIKAMFRTTVGRAFLVMLFNWLAGWIIIGILYAINGETLAMQFKGIMLF